MRCRLKASDTLHAALGASNSGNDFIKHLLPASQIAGYGLGSALLFPLVTAALLLILTKGRLSYKPDRVVQSAEALRPTFEGVEWRRGSCSRACETEAVVCPAWWWKAARIQRATQQGSKTVSSLLRMV